MSKYRDYQQKPIHFSLQNVFYDFRWLALLRSFWKHAQSKDTLPENRYRGPDFFLSSPDEKVWVVRSFYDVWTIRNWQVETLRQHSELLTWEVEIPEVKLLSILTFWSGWLRIFSGPLYRFFRSVSFDCACFQIDLSSPSHRKRSNPFVQESVWFFVDSHGK